MIDWWNTDSCELDEIVGKTPVAIVNEDNEIHFKMSDGSHYVMLHCQDCCERVTVEDIAGDLNDLLNTPITVAEVRSNYKRDKKYGGDQRWTFYELQSAQGYATIRWYGSSNGYYGTSVDFRRVSGPAAESTPSF